MELPRACGRRHFYGPLPVWPLQGSKSDRLLERTPFEADLV